MGDDSEWMKLPIDQKCEHKVSNSVCSVGPPDFLLDLKGQYIILFFYKVMDF